MFIICSVLMFDCYGQWGQTHVMKFMFCIFYYRPYFKRYYLSKVFSLMLLVSSVGMSLLLYTEAVYTLYSVVFNFKEDNFYFLILVYDIIAEEILEEYVFSYGLWTYEKQRSWWHFNLYPCFLCTGCLFEWTLLTHFVMWKYNELWQQNLTHITDAAGCNYYQAEAF